MFLSHIHRSRRGNGGAFIGIMAACILPFLLGLTTRAGEEQLVVMTYNIHHGESMDGALSLVEIARVIESHDVDVVGLQEVDRHWSDRSAFADQVEELAERLGMYAFFGPIYDLPSVEAGRPNRMYGLAILSRFPITAARNYELTRLPTVAGEDRSRVMPGFPMATVDVNGTPLHIYDTHLDYRSDPALREIEVEETLEILAETAGPKVLMGDFNAPPRAPELAPLFSQFVDAWQVRGEGDGFTYPADTPVRRIDYIFTSPDIRVESAQVVETTTSDHRPVVARLALPPAGR